MSTAHLVIVSCTRCGHSEQFDPIKIWARDYRPIGSNKSADENALSSAALLRPVGWGSVEMRHAQTPGRPEHLLRMDLCPGCLLLVAACAHGNAGGVKVEEEERHG